MVNLLSVPRSEFLSAMKAFRIGKRISGTTLLCYEGEFLSLESGATKTVMRATGEWHGRAKFSSTILQALIAVPPSQDPITISYSDGHLSLGGLRVACEWTTVSNAFIEDLKNPRILDLLAMERSLPRVKVLEPELSKAIAAAQEKLERRLKKALEQLKELEITEPELRALIEARIKARLRRAT